MVHWPHLTLWGVTMQPSCEPRGEVYGYWKRWQRLPQGIQEAEASGLERWFLSSFFKKINFIYFWLCWDFVAARRLSLAAASGGYSSLRCSGFSLRWLLLLQSRGSRHTGCSSCGSRALERRLSSCGAWAYLLHGMWDLPGPGFEPVSPALAGGVLTTAPPGKPDGS